MADSRYEAGLTASTGGISGATRSALEGLTAPQAVSVMEEMLRAAADNNNNDI